jgi:hypothetical protein
MKFTRNISLALMIPAFIYSCGGSQTTEQTDQNTTIAVAERSPSLTKVWETTEELTTNESALFDADSDVIFIANIDGDPAGKDGKGFISKISTSGEILEKEWVTGLDAPKGMGISNGKLYVTNIDELVEIEVASGKITNRFKIEGASFLNDVDTSGDKVYFTDMKKGKIHLFENGSFSLFAENQNNINGIRIAEDGTVYSLDGAGLKKYNSDGSFTIVNDKVTGGDGLVILEDNVFVASRWQGEIYLIKDGVETMLLDTKAEESNTADIDYIPSEGMVIVPTFFKNKVVGYKLDY